MSADNLAKIAAWFATNQPQYDLRADERRRLIRELHAYGMTVIQLAKLSGITRAAVYNIIKES